MVKFNDMHLHVTLQLAMGARNEHAAQLWTSRVCVYNDVVFSPWKRKSLLSLPFTEREPLISTGGCTLQCFVFLHAFFSWRKSSTFRQTASSGMWHSWWSRLANRRTFSSIDTTNDYLFSAVFSEWRITALCLFRLIHLSVLIFVGEEKERGWLDRHVHTFLVSCPFEHHLGKERSSAPSKWCSFDNSLKERHSVCEIHVRAILRCGSSEWRVTASGFSIARLSRRDWCALQVSICYSFFFLSRRAAAGYSASGDLSLYWQRMRIPWDTIDARGLLNFETFYLTDPRNADRPTHKSLPPPPPPKKTGQTYMFKVEF